MRALVLLIVGVLGFAQTAVAQDTVEARKVLAAQFVGMTESDSLLAAMNKAVWPGVEAEIRKDNPSVSPQVLAALEQIAADDTKVMVSRLVAIEADAYASAFTATELQDIIDFYKSPTGAKMLANRPKLMAKMMPTLIEQSQLLQRQMTDQLKQAAHDKGLKL